MRGVILATVLSLVVVGLVVANAAPGGPCTKTGTNERNVMAGTPGRDVLCALEGNDYVAGLGGPDILLGAGGGDTMVGGSGADKLYGGPGRDHLFVVDGRSGDFISGGGGLDHCFVDAGDRVQGCHVVHGVTLRTVRALSRAFGGEAVVGEELISVGPQPPPPITITQTIIITGPDCEGHPAPPPIC